MANSEQENKIETPESETINNLKDDDVAQFSQYVRPLIKIIITIPFFYNKIQFQ